MSARTAPLDAATAVRGGAGRVMLVCVGFEGGEVG